jgi:hypothetical protein
VHKLESSYNEYARLKDNCANSGCDFQLDMDGQVTCVKCGAMDDENK